jgi:hypothetical protein
MGNDIELGTVSYDANDAMRRTVCYGQKMRRGLLVLYRISKPVSKIKTKVIPSLGQKQSMENAGIEPATLSMLRTRAANCANSPNLFRNDDSEF